MKNQMYIALLVLPLLAGCGNKKKRHIQCLLRKSAYPVQVYKTLHLLKTTPAICL